MPGAAVTDTSQAIGAAGSDLSGQALNRPGGGGVATGNQQTILADIMAAANAPAAAPGSEMVHAYYPVKEEICKTS